MYKLQESFVHKFYNCAYIRNRFPSPVYVTSESSPFIYPESPEIIAVVFGYKPSVLLASSQLKNEMNDYYLTRCYYAGKELFYLDEDNVVICDRSQIEEFRAVFEKEDSNSSLGRLLGYPEHLIELFNAYICLSDYDWQGYNKEAERIALGMCF